MLFQGIEFFKIITTNQEDFDFLKLKYQNTGVVVELSDYKNLQYSELPCIVIGKEYSSLVDKYEYNILKFFDSNIKLKPDVIKKIDSILEKVVYLYKPYEYITYDAILDGEIFDFLFKNIDKDKKTYLYFYKKCLYLYSYGKLIAINLETFDCVNENFKKVVDRILKEFNCCIFSFSNFHQYVSDLNELSLLTFENIVWCKQTIEINESDLFQHFAGVNIYKNIPYLMDIFMNQNVLSDEEIYSVQRYYKKDYITYWLSNRLIYFNEKISGFNLKKNNQLFYTKLNYSNKRTLTGRINVCDNQTNIQMLPKQSDVRTHLVSRYPNGKIVVFDYVSFEFKIAIFSTGNLDFIKKFEENDMHNYISKIIFNKKNISYEERKVAKDFNHALLFGGGEEKLKSIIQHHDSSLDFNKIYNQITQEIKPIIELSNHINQQFKDYGFIKNAYNTIIRPRKNYAAFNNFIQSTASEIVVEKLFILKEFIKNKKIQFLYQVYDSFILDFDESELNEIEQISSLLSEANKLKFLVDYKIGANLMECGLKEFHEDEIAK